MKRSSFFQEYYVSAVYPGKIAYLTEYYKFHKDMARLFMEPLNHIVNYYYEKQRKIKYAKITKMLKVLIIKLIGNHKTTMKYQHKNEISSTRTWTIIEKMKTIRIKDSSHPWRDLLAPLESFLRKSRNRFYMVSNCKRTISSKISLTVLLWMNQSEHWTIWKMKLADIVGGNS